MDYVLWILIGMSLWGLVGSAIDAACAWKDWRRDKRAKKEE